MKKHNFYAGPSILSEYVINNTAAGVLNLDGIGLSVMEISHRSKEFSAIIKQAKDLVKELLEVPEGYEVLFLGGGASMQFCMIPFNFLNTKAAFLDTGAWSSAAIKEAKLFGEVDIVASSKDKNYNYIPREYVVPSDADYFHFTSNNTIYGTQLKEDPEVNVPLIADMSSDIFSRTIDVSKYSVIYGGAQKNAGPAGVAFVIIKKEMLENISRNIPSMLDYRIHVAKESLYNTPPCINIFAMLQTLKWYYQKGGTLAMQKINEEKAAVLYNEIERNPLFKCPVTEERDRSLMNVAFVMNDEYKELEAEFLSYSAFKDIVGIKGHRSVGGFRASIYNGMPLESVKHLVEVMKRFESKI